jgi:lambda repressor-like predicted transcriptional regulator
MEFPHMTKPSSALADLQSNWHTLHDLDRGRSVFAIHRNGISLRELARKLNCNESLLRRLLKAIQAPVEDQLLARQGTISTSELIRRAKAAEIRRTANEHEALELERTQNAVRGSKAICAWLVKEQVSGGYGEQIHCEAQRHLAEAEQTNRFPLGAAPADLPVEEIIRMCKPAGPTTDAVDRVARFAYWLAVWAYYAITDSCVRYRAFELALNAQFKR